LVRSRCLARALAERGANCELLLRGWLRDDGIPDWPGGAERVSVIGDERGAGGVLERAEGRLAVARCEWVVVDGYDFPGEETYLRLARRGARVLRLDDTASVPLQADVVLNQNTSDERLYAVAEIRAERLLLGPRYALIPVEYSHVRERRSRRGGGERVLVAFGGGDGRGWSFRVLDALRAYPARLGIDVAAGIGRLERDGSCGDACGHEVRVHGLRASLASLMEGAVAMIGAAGSTVWQACCAGLPLVALQTAENQREVIKTLSATRAAITGSASQVLENQAGHAVLRGWLDELRDPAAREGYARRARELVDGRGAERVVEVLLAC